MLHDVAVSLLVGAPAAVSLLVGAPAPTSGLQLWSGDVNSDILLAMAGVDRWVAVFVLAHGTVACSSPDAEHAGHVRSVDRTVADAQPHARDSGHDSGPVGPGPRDAASTTDARGYHCNVPEPGPCCCDPLVLEMQRSGVPASFACDFVLPRKEGEYRLDPTKINITVRDASGAETILPFADECLPNTPGWLFSAEDPLIVSLCPASCQSFASGEYLALRVVRGCPAIACPPF